MISPDRIKYILGQKDPGSIEEMARQARDITIREFGRTISLFTPLYLSNHCENRCDYCSFNGSRKIRRSKLNLSQIKEELIKISESGIQNILFLCGESRKETPPDYLIHAIKMARPLFPSIGLEIYPLDEEEYRSLYLHGADSITIYQETYNRKQYQKVHQSGKKADFDFRYHTPERIARSGIRMLNMGILLGLSPVGHDLYQLYRHLKKMESTYPGIEYSLSFPRLIPPPHTKFYYSKISDITLVKIICMTRLLFPRVGITLSTRERPEMRDHAIHFGATRLSAASRTTVGGYASTKSKNGQFEVRDNRSVRDMIRLIKSSGYDPVFTDWRRISNEFFP